ncbi:hypothetical protein EB796_018195 [Bugula neritina]|uniref:EF-hand domain-containing protein n=1 Tax=Bugula neritina TaxID=10212 RepID=A0A7J7JDP6_BUGNE|nr:hypothetical protein EB796_018195 [Bugula neritina]
MAVFAAQDRKKDGLISAADFKAIMCNLGEKVNARMVEAVLRKSIQTGSQIRYAEVLQTLLSPPADYNVTKYPFYVGQSNLHILRLRTSITYVYISIGQLISIYLGQLNTPNLFNTLSFLLNIFTLYYSVLIIHSNQI